MSAAEHYEAQAAEAGELARLRAENLHLKYLLAGAVPLAEHDATIAPLRCALEAIARPTTGYQCWHITAARAALEAPEARGEEAS